MIPLRRHPVGELFESLEDPKKHPAHESSVQALKSEKVSGRLSRRHQQILAIMTEKNADMTAREVHAAMQSLHDPLIQDSQISARMNELKKAGAIYLFDRRICTITKKFATSWRVK